MNLTKLVASGKKELLEDSDFISRIGLEVPLIVKFVDECRSNGHEINYYSNILDLLKGVYRDVF